MQIVLLIHLAATWCLVGLIWTIQVVHYPLFAQVGSATFASYQVGHMSRIILIVLPLMFTELITAAILLLHPPQHIPTVTLWFGFALIVVIWACTALINVPQHTALSTGFDATIHRALLVSNWVRTLAWTARGLLLLWALSLMLRSNLQL